MSTDSGSGQTRGERGRVGAATLTPVRIGAVEVLIETLAVAGSEPTSGAAGAAVDRVSAAFDQGQETIVAVAEKVAATISELASRAVHPDHVEVEFGLSFSATGKVIVAGATVGASLNVTLTWDHPGPPPSSDDPGIVPGVSPVPAGS